MSKTTTAAAPTRAKADVVKEFQPLDDGQIHGVTFDGNLVWFARTGELIAFDPNANKVVHRHTISKAGGGTAFDGEHIYQLADAEILVIAPKEGRVVRRLPSPGKGQDSGMAYADGHLWVGQYRSAKIHKIDAKTGEVVKTFTSDRFVTGVSCVDGALWHGASGDDKPTELRRLNSADGTVEEVLDVSQVPLVSGVERTKDGDFWCGGSKGVLRRVRKAG